MKWWHQACKKMLVTLAQRVGVRFFRIWRVRPIWRHAPCPLMRQRCVQRLPSCLLGRRAPNHSQVIGSRDARGILWGESWYARFAYHNVSKSHKLPLSLFHRFMDTLLWYLSMCSTSQVYICEGIIWVSWLYIFSFVEPAELTEILR